MLADMQETNVMRLKQLLLGLVLSGLFIAAAAALGQSGTTEIGIPEASRNAFELIGQIDQLLFNSTVHGYVTYIDGIATTQLFAPGTLALDRGAEAARVTFSGSGAAASRSIHENIFSSEVNASLTFYYSEVPAGATFDDPATFAQGTPIATMRLRLYSILNVQEPNVGVLMASADATQDSATAFTINGQTYQFGHVGLLERFTLFGQGFRSAPEPSLVAMYRFAASAVVTGEQSP
jgi:hypothetical protein